MSKSESEIESVGSINSRPRRFSFSLLSALLLIAVAAVWIGYFHTRSELPETEMRLVKLKRSVSELVVTDFDSYDVSHCPPKFHGDNRFEIYLPPRVSVSNDPGSQPYRLCLASENIELHGLVSPNALRHPLSPGYHEIRFVFDNELGEFAKLYLDGKQLVDLADTNADGVFMQDRRVFLSTDENKDWVLFRGINMMSDQFFETDKGPGALVWIEKDPK